MLPNFQGMKLPKGGRKRRLSCMAASVHALEPGPASKSGQKLANLWACHMNMLNWHTSTDTNKPALPSKQATYSLLDNLTPLRVQERHEFTVRPRRLLGLHLSRSEAARPWSNGSFPNYCSQNGGNLYRAPYYNGNPNIGPRIRGNLDQYPNHCKHFSTGLGTQTSVLHLESSIAATCCNQPCHRDGAKGLRQMWRLW